jgi:hypothetical protein
MHNVQGGLKEEELLVLLSRPVPKVSYVMLILYLLVAMIRYEFVHMYTGEMHEYIFMFFCVCL